MINLLKIYKVGEINILYWETEILLWNKEGRLLQSFVYIAHCSFPFLDSDSDCTGLSPFLYEDDCTVFIQSNSCTIHTLKHTQFKI